MTKPPKSLSPAAIRRLHEAALDAGLYGDRNAVIAMLPVAVRASLPTANVPSQQALLDLSALNDMAKSGDSGPLRTWLESARLLSSAYQRPLAVIEEALRGLDSPPIPSLAQGPGTPDAEEGPITLKDLRSFLARTFTGAELRVLLSDVGGDTLTHGIAWDQPLAGLAFEVVELLRRHGVLNDAFFDQLCEARPSHRPFIDRLRTLA